MSFGPEYIHGLQVVLNDSLPWRVSKIEGGESWVALRVSPEVSGKKTEEWFLLSWGPGSAGCAWVDAESLGALKKGAPARTPLVEALKSRFVKGQIISARQLNYDRVLELGVVRFVAAGFRVKYFLILEATEPTGNLILLNEERKIEELARHASADLNRYRTLLPGHSYFSPPPFEGPLPSEMSVLEFKDLARLKGVGRPLLRLIEAHWAEREPVQWLVALQSLYGSLPVLCQRTSKGYLTRFPVAFVEAEALGEDALLAACEGVSKPLLGGSRSRLLRDLDTRVSRAVKSKERHIGGLLNQLKNSADADLFRRKGELLLANIASIPSRAEKIALSEWDGEGGKILEVELNPELSPSRNAERYFKKYKKARVDPQKIRDEAESIRCAIEELKEQRELLDSIDDPAKLEEAVRDVADWLSPAPKSSKLSKKDGKKQDLPPHLRFEFDGCTIFVGLSARGNRFVTFKQATSDDLWLHAHEIPGAHVIVKGARGRKELEGSETLAVAASLAASHSRGKTSLSVQVDYTERRYVRSVPGAAIALVTYVNPGTLRADPGYWKEALKKNPDD